MITVKRGSLSWRMACLAVVSVFAGMSVFTDMMRVRSTPAASLGLPEPAQVLESAGAYDLPVLAGMRFDPQDPFRIDFLVNTGDAGTIDTAQAGKLLRFFLAALTIPDTDLWVNLSPYEPERIVSASVTGTELGDMLLGQDYILKQFVSSLTSPHTALGKEYWSGKNAAGAQAFDKVWIVADRAAVNRSGATVLITEADLTVMTQQDYAALHADTGKASTDGSA